MNSNSGAETYGAEGLCRNIAISRRPGLAFPVDYRSEMPIDRLAVNARSAYLIDLDVPESVRSVRFGRHQVYGGRQMVVLESEDRLYISPEDDCILEFGTGKSRLQAPGSCGTMADIGVKRKSHRTIFTDPDTESLFRCISDICSAPGDLSPCRSHPFFRQDIPGVVVSGESASVSTALSGSSIAFHLPPDLKYLFAIAPLAFYTGASVDTGERPSVDIRGETIELPGSYRQFERWAGRMLSRTFQADCAVRYSAATGRCLSGFDVQAIFGYAPEEMMLMSMHDRFRLYMEKGRSACRAFNVWHTASYVDPLPSSIGLMPYLMRSLSAIYAPSGSPVTERDVVSLSVRHFQSQQSHVMRGETGTPDTVLLPSLYNAQAQLWFSDGCPVDASLSSIGALKNGRKYPREKKMPEVCIVCNEGSMMNEALLVRERLEGIATVDVRKSLNRSDFIHTFTEGFDILHYAGHGERTGIKCRDGYADFSSVEESNVPFFFLNCCYSYTHGIRLIEKGSVCGIAPMFRVIDEAAVDVCTGFYRMLASGYPVIASYMGARECSVTGKEYLLIGDGSYNIFNGCGAAMPFYRLRRNGSGFTLKCTVASTDKGLVLEAGNGRAIPDTGFEITCLQASDLPRECVMREGMCYYSGNIYDSVSLAVKTALVDLYQAKSLSNKNAF